MGDGEEEQEEETIFQVERVDDRFLASVLLGLE